MKPYVFNENEYTDLNSLALAYKENFDLGVKDIYTNTKKLIKFVKANTKNKERVKAVVEDIALSKFKNNALTFVIYELLDIKEVVFNGKVITFEQFIALIKQNPDKNNALFAFLQDHGVTRLFERQEPTLKYFKDMYYVERNWDNDFTYKYLSSLFDYEIKEALDKKISSIAIQNEECFRRASKLVRTDEFLLGIAHTYGFKEAITLVKEKNGVFHALKLFKNDSKADTEDEHLRRIIDDTFYWWLYNNYQNYTAKGKAKQVISRLNRIKTEYSAYTKKMKSKEIAKITFDYYADISRRLYLVYTDFVYFYRAGLITPNKKVEASKYELDKPYCRTYICEDFMKGRVVKLYNPNKDNGSINVNPLTGEEIKQEEQNTAVLIDDVLDSVLKNINATKGFAAVSSLFAIGFLFAAALMFVVSKMKVEPSPSVDRILSVYTMTNIIIGAAAAVLTFIFAIVLYILEVKREKAIENFRYLKEANTQKVLTIHEEEKVFNLSSDIDNIRYLVSRENKVTAFIVTLLFSVAASVSALLFVCTLSTRVDFIKFADAYSNIIAKILVFAVPAVFGAILGFTVKKKGLIFVLLMSILVTALVAGVITIFGIIA